MSCSIFMTISVLLQVIATMTRKLKQRKEMRKRSSVKSTTVQNVGYSCLSQIPIHNVNSLNSANKVTPLQYLSILYSLFSICLFPICLNKIPIIRLSSLAVLQGQRSSETELDGRSMHAKYEHGTLY